MDGRESSECLGTWECSSKPHASRPSTQIQPRETLTKSTVKRVIGLQIPFRRQVSLPSSSPPTLVLDIVWKHRVQAKPGAPGRWLLDAVLGQSFAVLPRSPGHRSGEGVSGQRGMGSESGSARDRLAQCGRASVLHSSALGAGQEVGQLFRLCYIIFCALVCLKKKKRDNRKKFLCCGNC